MSAIYRHLSRFTFIRRSAKPSCRIVLGRTATARASTRSSGTVIVYDHLNGEIFYSLAEARVVIEAWRVHYNTARPHSSLGYRPPAPEAVHWAPF
ncbi:hypothetical protein B5V46_04225 [Rhodovulum sp. MB263]|nr:hypothetical protein B5V46_04225 [Rhodovulum sp. MB263]